MASVQAIAVRREAAINRLNAEAQQAAEQYDIEIGEFPSTVKASEPLKEVLQIEWVSSVLAGINGNPMDQSPAAPAGPDFAAMSREEMNAYGAAHGVADPESFDTKEDLHTFIANIEGGFIEPQVPIVVAEDEQPDFKKMNRDALNAWAHEHGFAAPGYLAPEQYETKAALIAVLTGEAEPTQVPAAEDESA